MIEAKQLDLLHSRQLTEKNKTSDGEPWGETGIGNIVNLGNMDGEVLEEKMQEKLKEVGVVALFENEDSGCGANTEEKLKGVEQRIEIEEKGNEGGLNLIIELIKRNDLGLEETI